MKNGKKKIIFFSVLMIIIISLLCAFLYFRNEHIRKEKLKAEKLLVQKIKNSYSRYVSIDDAFLYKKNGNKYEKIAKVFDSKQFTLADCDIDKNTKYFLIEELGYYVRYQDVSKIDSIDSKDLRYKNYLPFNMNVVTNDKVSLYQDDKKIYELYYSLDTPIIELSDSSYIIEFNDEEYLVKDDDIVSTHEASNTDLVESVSVPVTVYHFIYLEGDNTCGESICHSEKQIREQFEYLSSNNFFTLTTTELGKFIDGKIRLPEKSVLVTIDDGARAWNFVPLLEEYKINATLFLISGWYDVEQFESPYMEIASHTHDLHNPGYCPLGQGSPLKCLDRELLLDDLKKSREKLSFTKAFCFPFYEYNDYAISIIKEAGFELGFIGGGTKVTKGINKFKIPRISISSSTSLSTYINYVS